MSSLVYSASKIRLSSWASNMSPKILTFIEGLTSDNKTLSTFEVARLGLGADRFFCFGSWDGHRTLLQQAKLYCHARYIKPVITDNGERIAYDTAEQKYDNGISPNKDRTVTNAKGGESYHNWGCAIDLYICNSRGVIDWSLNYNKLYQDLGLVQWANECGLTWGGSWADNGHFQDGSIKLPSAEFWTESNCKKGYNFIVPNGGGKVSTVGTSGESSNKKKWAIVAAVVVALLAVVGIIKLR